MAKSREVSKRSRAARRATSPSINTDKSLKNVSAPQGNTARPSILSTQYSAGIQKRGLSKRKAQLSAKARKRQQRGMEMAEAVLERTSKKLEKSHVRSGVVQSRARNWEDVNKAAKILEVEGLSEDDDDKNGDKEWETDDEIDPTEEAKTNGNDTDAVDAVDAVDAAAAPVLDDDLDEIL